MAKKIRWLGSVFCSTFGSHRAPAFLGGGTGLGGISSGSHGLVRDFHDPSGGASWPLRPLYEVFCLYEDGCDSSWLRVKNTIATKRRRMNRILAVLGRTEAMTDTSKHCWIRDALTI